MTLFSLKHSLKADTARIGFPSAAGDSSELASLFSFFLPWFNIWPKGSRCKKGAVADFRLFKSVVENNSGLRH